MLLQFTVGNFKSFKDKVTLSMEATADDWREEDNVTQLEQPKRRLLKTAAIYGANASGKSNLIEAMVRFRTFVVGSSKDSQKGDPIPVVPFRLSTQTKGAPTFFEVIFVKEGTRYRYGFEATSSAVVSEWLFEQRESIRETTLFTRLDDAINVSAAYKEGKGLESKTRANALFLSVVAQFNGKTATEIVEWTERSRPISGLEALRYRNETKEMLSDQRFAGAIRLLVNSVDSGIQDVFLEESSDAELEKKPFFEAMMSGIGAMLSVIDPLNFAPMKSSHRSFDAEGNPVGLEEFEAMTDWSGGTRKFFTLVGPFLKSLDGGSLLVIDEIDERLHPLLTRKLVDLFNSSANVSGAQLVFATHDSGLLDPRNMRRDQIWFVEKDSRGASEIFSLAEIKGVRKEANFEKEYLMGQFGGVPRIGDLQSAVSHVEK